MSNPSEHIYELIERYVAGTLSEAQEHELVEQLRSNEKARRLYIEYRELDYALRTTTQAGVGNGLKDVLPLGFQDAEVATFGSVSAGNVTSVPNACDALGGSASPLQTNPPLFFSTTFVSALACMLIVAVVAFIAVNLGSRNDSLNSGAEKLNSVAANLNSSNSAKNDSARSSQTLKIESGTARINLHGMGSVVAEGPTDFRLISPNRARLNYGSIKVQGAGASAQGFTVETPLGDVIDWGNEFGLSVQKDKRAKLVVLDGIVDLRLPDASTKNEMITERLTQGDGVFFGNTGSLDRINAICRNGTETFSLCSELNATANDVEAIITDVSDNIDRQTKKFYEIVHRGLQEDTDAFVDRDHQWNGVTQAGMPKYLLNADYVKTFNSDRNLTDRGKIALKVTLSRPAKLYLFVDDRSVIPQWLTKNFRKTGDKIGLDEGKKVQGHELDQGAGKSVDNKFSIWVRIIAKSGVVELGANPKAKSGEKVAMYGIAAVPLEPSEATNQVQ